MPLNKAKGNMYPFVDYTWNVIKGECPHGCAYCYMKRWGKQNPIRFDAQETRTALGCDNVIFVGSSCDMWADAIPDDWIKYILEYAHGFKNKYFFQTKNPERFTSPSLGLSAEKDILCTTIETNWYFPGISEKAPRYFDRAGAMGKMSAAGFTTMVTVEPILDFEPHSLIRLIKECGPVQVNIGADSGNNHLPEPPKGKLIELIAELNKFTKVFEKKNLGRLTA